jgi:hypothetical protein
LLISLKIPIPEERKKEMVAEKITNESAPTPVTSFTQSKNIFNKSQESKIRAQSKASMPTLRHEKNNQLSKLQS